ncbi:MAG: hypothetical protein IJP78_02370 [Clostridia bacterium]|nr:hypothetical protein [Clostridia bacterium]
MFKLMKYEFRKTWITKLILLGVTAVAEAVYLFGLYTEKEGPLSVSVMLLTMLAVFGVLVIGLESVLTLHRDMNTKQSYMLFMTPNSGYQILGAKVLECGLSILITGAFYFALGAMDITLLFAKSGQLNQLWDMIQNVISQFTINGRPLTINAEIMAALTFSLLTGWIGIVTMAYLADVVSAALLNGKKYNGLLSFAVFLALTWLTSWATGKITAGITASTTMLVVNGLIDLGFAVIMYIVTAQIMERKLSV